MMQQVRPRTYDLNVIEPRFILRLQRETVASTAIMITGNDCNRRNDPLRTTVRAGLIAIISFSTALSVVHAAPASARKANSAKTTRAKTTADRSRAVTKLPVKPRATMVTATKNATALKPPAVPAEGGEPVAPIEARHYLLAQNTTATATGSGGGSTAPPGSGSTATGSFSIVSNGFTPSSPADVAKVLGIALNDSRIKIDVASLPNGSYVAVLSGAIHPAEKNDLMESVGLLANSGIATIITRVKYDADLTARDLSAKKDPPENSDFWDLIFIDSPLGTGAGAAQYQVGPMVEALNKIYGKDANKPPVQAFRNGLMLRGTSDLRNDIKRQLVLIDAPGPQVQLDVWALQMSDKRGPELEKMLRENMDQVRAVQKVLPAVPVALYVALARRAGYRRVPPPLHGVYAAPPPPYPAVPLPPAALYPPPMLLPTDPAFQRNWNYWIDQMIVEQLRSDLKSLRYDPEPRNSTSLNNSLILLSLEDRVGCDAIISEVEKETFRVASALGLTKGSAIRLKNLRATYDVPVSWDGKTPAVDYRETLFPERETIRNFIEAVMAYRASARGDDGRASYRKRLSAKLEQVIAQPNFQVFPDYRDLYLEWKRRETDPDDAAEARKDTRYSAKLAEGLTYLQLDGAKTRAIDNALTARGQVPGTATKDQKEIIQKTEEFREAYRVELEKLKPPTPSMMTALKKERLLEQRVKGLLENAPEDLRRTSAAADNLLKVAVDAFTADMQEIFLRPALERLTKKSGPNGGGVSLVGQSRLVVTSGLETRLAPQLVSYVETTRPAPMSKETLDMAFPGSKTDNRSTTTTTNVLADGTATTTGTGTATNASGFSALTGTAQILAGLNPAQALLLSGALNPPTPTFTRVAPGVGINVRPAVMPDGGAARLQVDMTFGVDATAVENAAAKNVLQWPVADSVKSHTVTTDAIVSSFDLFDISSFNLTTSYPRPPGYVPVLGTLPVIGKAFQWRRKNTQIEHHSMILVNTVILPRSLDIVQLYAGTVP